ncbi:MAG: DNA translocase FtsK 4TM domain-containing protein [bacterium]|nr:DNA translocase FtsK 4TM domain-containing protein [bacterium]
MRRRRRNIERRRGVLPKIAREWEKFGLAPETRRTVAALFWFLAGVISILSLFGIAGRVGVWLEPRLFLGFGFGAYVLPFVVALVAVSRLDPDRFPFSRGRYLGLLLAIVSGLGLLHVPASPEESLALADEGRGGGYAGWIVSYWLHAAVGGPTMVLALVVLFAAGLMLVSNRTPGQFFSWVRARRAERAQERLAEAAAEPAAEPVEETPADVEEPEVSIGGEEPEPVSDLPLFSARALDGVRTRSSRQQAAGSRATRLPPYEPPPLTLLSDATTRPVSTDIKATQQVIQRTLETFDISVEMDAVSVGPTVTQYTLKPSDGVKISKIVALHNDLALALAAHPIRIEAPIPGKGLVGIEVPNKVVSIVRLREVLSSDVFKKSPSPLTFSLGKDVAGEPITEDLARMPHLLIAGATGSGKSVLVHGLLVSLLYRNSPVTLKLLLVDPKRVELPLYNGIPHLLSPVIIEPEKTVNALRWAVAEMDRRYELLSAARKRDLGGYNAGKRPEETLPNIVIIIDELADIMARHARELENAVIRLAQIARAVGIHLVLATQRPSVDVITGLIKANITSRVAFKVASAVDSRTILDTAGAEKLLGSGDMLFLASDHTKPRRIQGSYVSEEEVKRVVRFLTANGAVAYDESITASQSELSDGAFEDGNEEVDDTLFREARRVVIEAGRASTSLLQRRLRIGYARAARIMDMLEERGMIGPPDGARPREVLVSNEEPGRSEQRPSTPLKDGGARSALPAGSVSPSDGQDAGTPDLHPPSGGRFPSNRDDFE